MEEIINRINSFILAESGSDTRFAIQNWHFEIVMDFADVIRLSVSPERFFVWRFDSPNQAKNVYRTTLNNFSIEFNETELAQNHGRFFCVFI
jgi:hypothetical protein